MHQGAQERELQAMPEDAGNTKNFPYTKGRARLGDLDACSGRKDQPFLRQKTPLQRRSS